jgi:hypothetical protein
VAVSQEGEENDVWDPLRFHRCHGD